MDFSSIILLSRVLSLLVCISSSPYVEGKKVQGCRGKLLYDNLTSESRASKKIWHDLAKLTIPNTFDSRKKWPYCQSIKYIYSQGSCGGCWAFAAVSVMSDRLCIATEGQYNKLLSVQDAMECCTNCVDKDDASVGGCEGGYVSRLFQYWTDKGIVTGEDGCKPLSLKIKLGFPSKTCRTYCTKWFTNILYEKDKTYSTGTVLYLEKKSTMATLKQVQAEIMLNGPVAGAMNVYDYIKDVPPNTILKYDPHQISKGKTPEGHAIKLIGWDVVKGIPVWIMANSWGSNWCSQGFCYIRRGQNDFEIESSHIFGGIPKISGVKAKPGILPSASDATRIFKHFTKTLVLFAIYLSID